MQKWIKKYETSPVPNKEGKYGLTNSWRLHTGASPALSPITLAAERSGLDKMKVNRVANGTQHWMTWADADALFTAIDEQDWGRDYPELVPYFWQGEVPPDMSKPCLCACGCGRWFEANNNGGKGKGRDRIYFTASCRSKVYGDKNRAARRKSNRERNVIRYHTDPTYRERQLKGAAERYRKNRKKRIQYARDYRARQKEERAREEITTRQAA